MATQPDVTTERLDDVPLLIHVMSQQMEYDKTVDDLWPRHGNWLGLSLGQMLVTWLAHIVSQHNHMMRPMQKWANAHNGMLSRLWNQELRGTDLSDDRLAEGVRVLSLDSVWHPLEQQISQRQVRVYCLAQEIVRLDATSAKAYGGDETSVMFRQGHFKDHRPDLAQFKAMLASLDPLRLPVAVDVVPSNEADDSLYVPLIERVRTILDPKGLLYVADCKMGAPGTRAHVQRTDNFYLMPLAHIGQVPEDLDHWVTAVLAGQVALTPLPTEDGKTILGQGYELTRDVQHESAAGTLTWTERVLVVRSDAYAKAAQRGLEQRLSHAQAALQTLTPSPGCGRHPIRDEAVLRERAAEILAQYEVTGLLEIQPVRHSLHKHARAYQGNPAHDEEEQVHFTVAIQRHDAAIAQVVRTLGWRAYATNAPRERLSLEQAALAYREEWLVERNFARLKGRVLSLAPVWLSLEDHAIGLTRLLTLAARVMAIVDYQVRRELREAHETLRDLYAGQPTRETARPTTERLLEAFKEINLTVIRLGEQVLYHVTPLSELQKTILRLLHCPRNLDSRLAADVT